MIHKAAFIESLPQWIWVYQGHADPAIRFFYRVPREALFALISGSLGRVEDNVSGWVYAEARKVGCKADRILAFVHGEPVTYIAMEPE